MKTKYKISRTIVCLNVNNCVKQQCSSQFCDVVAYLKNSAKSMGTTVPKKHERRPYQSTFGTFPVMVAIAAHR